MASQSHLELEGRRIGPGEPCFLIAEAGVNHNGSLDMALQLVDAAAQAGADAVKFQKRHVESLYPPSLLRDPNSAEWAFQYLLPVLQQTELGDDDFKVIQERCHQQGIRFLCTPWDEPSLELLERLDVELYKVASADLVNLPFLDRLAQTGKPLILSTGMATEEEIERTVGHLNEIGACYALLHCVSTYPAPFESLNLRFLERLARFGAPIGYSGHERGIAIPLVALTLGATIIEKHITLDRTLPGPDHPASLEPGGMQRLVRDVRHAEMAFGEPRKHLSTMEMLNRQVLRKSLVAARDLPAGTLVETEMVRIKGPGKGLSPQRLDELLGTVLDRDINADDYFSEGDLKTGTEKTLDPTGLRRAWGLKARFHDLAEALEKKPQLVELHFSAKDVEHPFPPVSEPHPQQLFIHAPEFYQQRLLDLCSEDDTEWEKSIALLQRTIDKAAELAPSFQGPVGVVIHVGGMTMDEPARDNARLLRRAADAFRRLDARGTQLLPENLPPRPWYLGGQWVQNVFIRPEELVEFCQELDLGMTLDVSHAQLFCNYYGQHLDDFVQRCLPHVRHLHLADASGIDGEGLQIGEGVIEWDSLLDLLSRQDFTWVPEIWSGHLHGGAGFIEAIDRLRRFDRL